MCAVNLHDPLSDIQRVAIVDDDRSVAEVVSWEVEDAGYERFIVEGQFHNVEDLARVVQENAQGALCDHRLMHSALANFYGASLVAALYERGFPAILVTQYTEIDEDVSIRKWRDKIPVLLSRDEADASNIRRGIAACILELKGNIPDTRKPYRVLLRVTDVQSESGESVVDVIIPGWNPDRAVRFPLSLIPHQMREEIRPGVHLFADVNIGAEDSSELFFKNFELAPALDEDDGLA